MTPEHKEMFEEMLKVYQQQWQELYNFANTIKNDNDSRNLMHVLNRHRLRIQKESSFVLEKFGG